MAPEETRTTLWPCDCSFIAVSTMTLRMERRGSWVVSSTMELVPVRRVSGMRNYLGLKDIHQVL